jgi:hypothetical protein
MEWTRVLCVCVCVCVEETDGLSEYWPGCRKKEEDEEGPK